MISMLSLLGSVSPKAWLLDSQPRAGYLDGIVLFREVKFLLLGEAPIVRLPPEGLQPVVFTKSDSFGMRWCPYVYLFV